MPTATKYKPYSKYKPSGIDWLGRIPDKWDVKRLRFLMTLQKGRKPEENTESADGLPYLTMDFLRGQEEPTKYAPAQESVMVDDGEILLLWDGANAGEFVRGSKGILSSTMAKMSLPPKLNSKYYFYFLISFEKKLRELTIGMGIPHVSGDIVKDCITPIPSSPEQKTIADYLDRETAKIDEVAAKKQKLTELLKEKRQALIAHAVTGKLSIKNYELRDKKNRNCKFVIRNSGMKPSGTSWLGDIPEGWEVRRIKMLCKISRGASPRPIDDEKYFDDNGEYAWVRIADLTTSNRYLETTTQRLSSLGKSLSVPLEPGEIFISIAGTVGSPIITKIKCCIHDGFVYFINLKYNRELLWYIFIAGEAYKGLGKLGTQLNLNTETVGNISIPIMSEREQKEIVAFLDREMGKTDEVMKKVEIQIEKLQEYRQALIISAVTGKIKIN